MPRQRPQQYERVHCTAALGSINEPPVGSSANVAPCQWALRRVRHMPTLMARLMIVPNTTSYLRRQLLSAHGTAIGQLNRDTHALIGIVGLCVCAHRHRRPHLPLTEIRNGLLASLPKTRFRPTTA